MDLGKVNGESVPGINIWFPVHPRVWRGSGNWDSLSLLVIYRMTFALFFSCFQSGTMAHTCDPSTWEARTGRTWAPGQPGLGSKSFSLKKRKSVVFCASALFLNMSVLTKVFQNCFSILHIWHDWFMHAHACTHAQTHTHFLKIEIVSLWTTQNKNLNIKKFLRIFLWEIMSCVKLV